MCEKHCFSLFLRMDEKHTVFSVFGQYVHCFQPLGFGQRDLSVAGDATVVWTHVLWLAGNKAPINGFYL